MTAANGAIAIGNRRIGAGYRPMMIAEMSGNHNGSLDAALRIVNAAAANGADAIKLQTYTPATLTIDSHRPEFFIEDPGSLWHRRRLWDLYQEAHTPWEWHVPIFEAMRAVGLSCISSAYDLSSLDFLLTLDVDAIKIASFELVHLPLIEAAARSGKPLLVSTGMGTIAEIDEAVAAMRDNGCDRFVLLKCTSAYPAVERDANVVTMDDLRMRYGCEVGLSDHTLTHFTAFTACALGAAVVEKHFTMARGDGGVDAAFSIEPQEWRELARGCELIWQSRGAVRYGPLASEMTSLKERPSIYVVHAMRRGDLFTDENIRVVRPSDGLAPARYHSVIGRTCVHDIAAGQPLTMDDINEQSR